MGHPESPLPKASPGWWPGREGLHAIKTSPVEDRAK